MKNFILIFWLLFFPLLYSQGEELYPTNELTVQVTNAPYDLITFELVPIGKVYCRDYNSFYEYQAPVFIHNFEVNSTGNVLCRYNGFHLRSCNDPQGDNRMLYECGNDYGAGLGPLRYGFYKMTVKEDGIVKGYCYFDWRDKGFTNGSNCFGNDMSIRYDGSAQALRFYPDRANPAYNELGTLLENGEILTWAELRCNTRDFSPFWSEGLISIPKYNASTGKYNPQIVWGPYSDPEITISYYRVYKKYGADPWQYIVVPYNQFTYVDESLNLIMGSGTGTSVQYQVIGMYNASLQTSPTNTVTVNTEGLQDIDKLSINS